MKQSLNRVINLGWDPIFWFLSVIFEIPYYFCCGILVTLFDGNGFNFERALGFGLLVGLTSLFCRVISLHLIGSWVLKRFLMKRLAGPIWFGLNDFLLANLWIGIWALFDPSGPTAELFHEQSGDAFRLTEIWFIAIPPRLPWHP